MEQRSQLMNFKHTAILFQKIGYEIFCCVYKAGILEF